MNERIDKIIGFLKEIDKFKEVEREIFLKNRRESDAEHAWHLAMFVFLFEKDLPKDLDLIKMFKLVLMHDLVEIYAGDTFIFDKEGNKTKKEREKRAAEKLFSKLPSDLEADFHNLFQEWEDAITKESKICHSFDKAQPMIQNILSDGKTWKKHGVTYEGVDEVSKRFFEDNGLMRTVYEKVMKEIRSIV
ncbi:MAG: HD domain-containing protein [archaeon]|nr:HD domain-containing protein [archaeon]